MRSTIVISKRGNSYFADVSGKFGGGYSGANAGSNVEEAAEFASKEMIRYGRSNKEGADLVAPKEVLSLVPECLQSIPDASMPIGRPPVGDAVLPAITVPEDIREGLQAETIKRGMTVPELRREFYKKGLSLGI